MLADKYRNEIERVLAKYPDGHKESAVMSLLYLAQQEYGHVSQGAMEEVGALVGMSATDVGSLVGFYTLYYDEKHQGGKHRIQVCTDLPCALRGADRFAEDLCKNLGVKLGGTTPDGMFTVEAVMCLAACDKAPMFQVQNASGLTYHESQTAETAMGVIEGLKKQ